MPTLRPASTSACIAASSRASRSEDSPTLSGRVLVSSLAAALSVTTLSDNAGQLIPDLRRVDVTAIVLLPQVVVRLRTLPAPRADNDRSAPRAEQRAEH